MIYNLKDYFPFYIDYKSFFILGHSWTSFFSWNSYDYTSSEVGGTWHHCRILNLWKSWSNIGMCIWKQLLLL